MGNIQDDCCPKEQKLFYKIEVRSPYKYFKIWKEKKYDQQENERTPLENRWEKFLNPIEHKDYPTKILDFNNIDSGKFNLTEESMEEFTKVERPHLTKVNFENNSIKDGGLQILCKKGNYPSLETLNLQDNGISINGIKNLLFNNWNKNVNIKLSSVQQNDGGLRLHVGESIPLLKDIIQKAQKKEKKELTEIDKLIPIQHNKSLNAINLLFSTPLDNEDNSFEQSRKLQQIYQNDSNKNYVNFGHLMVALRESIGQSVKFTRKPTIKSKLSTKIISTGILTQRIRFSQTFKKLDYFSFSDFKKNHRKVKQFQLWYFQYLQDNYGIDTSEMTVDRIVQGSIKVIVSDSFAKNINIFKKNNFQVQEMDFFQRLELNEEDFDLKNNYNFSNIESASNQKRGGLPYYQPVLGKRYAIKVWDQYENNSWLLMDGNKNQWAVGFHGVINPALKVQSQKTGRTISVMRSIMDGRERGNMLRQGAGQAFKDYTCLKSNQIVGTGIYVSPYFLTSLLQYSSMVAGSKYHIVLQCRAKPSSIRIGGREDYWVVNKRQDLRPYGIILFTAQDVKQFCRRGSSAIDIHRLIYKEEFNAQTWRAIYQKEYNEFHR